MRIESDLESKVLRLQTNLAKVGTVGAEQALRKTAQDTLVIIQRRVQEFGEGVAGTMVSKASRKIDAYSAWHYGNRRRKGLQTSKIDLTYDGDLFRAWQLLSSDHHEARIGFNNERMGERADYLEAYFGEIFAMREDEKLFAIETFKGLIEEHLRGG